MSQIPLSLFLLVCLTHEALSVTKIDDSLGSLQIQQPSPVPVDLSATIIVSANSSDGNVTLGSLDPSSLTFPPPGLSGPFSLPPPPPDVPSVILPHAGQEEEVGRLLIADLGLMLCFREWEASPNGTYDFQSCYGCFNKTTRNQEVLPKDQYISQVEDCFNRHISNTSGEEYHKECLPMLRNSTIPNKPHHFLFPSEPPFTYEYRNFGRCVHGVSFKQEALKCFTSEGERNQVTSNNSTDGINLFLGRFGCLMNKIIGGSKRLSETNLAELPYTGVREVREATPRNDTSSSNTSSLILPPL